MLEMISRRLIGTGEVAEKLGFSRQWFVENRKTLELAGFPPPILGGGHGSPLRWDNHAIDLWLDSKLPEDLKRHAIHSREATKLAAVDTFSLERHLADRAGRLAL